MRRSKQLLATALVLTTLAACSVNPATGDHSFTGFMSPEEEKRVGFEEHPKILQQHGGTYSNRNLARYVARIGGNLALNSETPNVKFTFTVLNDELVNAFALPGGYVYITRGLLALAENEAEVAGVLAHEIGHVVARHTAQRYSQSMAANLGMIALGIAVGNQAVSEAAGFGARAYLQGFSREHEMEADMLAVRYMTKAGYDPKAMESFFHKMAEHKKLQADLLGQQNDDNFDIMATHPRTADRVAQAIKLAKQRPVRSPIVGREKFLARLDGALYGDDPKEGIRKGRDFVHPGLGIKFTVPKGFHLINGKTEVVAKGPKGSAIVFDMETQRGDLSSTPLTSYISRMWAPKLRLQSLEPLSVNGLDGATAAAHNKNKDLRLVALRNKKGVFRFLFITPPEMTQSLSEKYRRTTYSFRSLSKKEIANVRPLRVKVLKTRSNETLESFAQWLPFETKRVERIKLLNKNLVGKPLAPGTRVKVIAQ